MRRKVKYRGFGGCYGFDAVVTNTTKGIVFSDVEQMSYHGSAEDMRNTLLSSAKPPYSSINTNTSDGRKELASKLEEEIIRLQDEIEYKRLLIQMCRKKKVSIRK